MASFTLYAFPGACSTVSHIAMEMASAPFTFEVVNLPAGQQRSPEYLKINPRGKVPALSVGPKIITESVAILVWLSQRFPEAKLLPARDTEAFVPALTDLLWFTATMHPLITRIAVPQRFVSTPDGADSVHAIAADSLTHELKLVNDRLAGRVWWSDDVSALDIYFCVLWDRLTQVPFDTSAFPQLASYADRVRQLPAVQRALAREGAALPRA